MFFLYVHIILCSSIRRIFSLFLVRFLFIFFVVFLSFSFVYFLVTAITLYPLEHCFFGRQQNFFNAPLLLRRRAVVVLLIRRLAYIFFLSCACDPVQSIFTEQEMRKGKRSLRLLKNVFVLLEQKSMYGERTNVICFDTFKISPQISEVELPISE